MNGDKRYFFISDIHLGLDTPEKEKAKEDKLLKFIEFASGNCDELFIMGDLFDYWFEYRRVYQKGYFRTLTAIHELVQKGITVHYFIGNHDFLHRDFFTRDLGVKLYPEEVSLTLNGRKFYLGHGDGLVKNDYGYLIVKKVLRNRVAQFLFSLIHPDLGIRIASGTSKKSRKYTSGKDYGELDGLTQKAEEMIDSGFDFVIFGHLHRRKFIKYKNGTYINLGTWLRQPCYGRFENGVFEIVDLT